MKIDQGIAWGALGGAALGALVALLTHRSTAPAPLAQEPFKALAELTAQPAVEPPQAPGRSPAPAQSATPKARAPSGAALHAPPPTRPLNTPAEVAEAELRCARGAPGACLDVGHAHAQLPGGETKGLTFRRRALVLFAEGCQRREPNACRQLSSLYEHGIGVARDANTAAALLQRYLELCASTKGACESEPE